MRQISKGLTNTIKWRVAQRVTRHFVFLAFCLLCAFYAFYIHYAGNEVNTISVFSKD